jgi:hypothetical protein
VRLNHDGKQSYTLQIINQIKTEIINSGGEIENIVAPITDVDFSLWEFFHSSIFWSSDNYPLILMIVLDQFEEIFTLTKNKVIVCQFFEELSDLCDNKIPKYIKEYLNSKKERREFLDTINYRLIISLREDFLARLEEYSVNIPSFRRNRFSLQSINEEQAMEIILKPSGGLVSEDVAIEIIRKVTNNANFKIDGVPEISVEPSLLSLFCNELNKKRIASDSLIISMDLLNEFGDNIITEYYENTISLISEKSMLFLERALLTSKGYRDSVALSDALENGVTNEEIDLLQSNRVIHVDEWDGTKRIEFTHDVLCKIAKEKRDERRVNQDLIKIELEQEEQRIQKNHEYNRQKRLSSLNVLTQKGRRLLSNALDFGEYRTIRKCVGKYSTDSILHWPSLLRNNSDEMFKEDVAEGDSQKIFRDPLLTDATYIMSFQKHDEKISTIDGVYAVSLKYNDNVISDISFYGRDIKNGNINYDSPIYIYGGFCGIHIDYDEHKREIRRVFLGDVGTPTINIDGYSIVETKYDECDNPVKIKYFILKDGVQLPCSHIHGNYGFDSKFDTCGNEIERVFFDKDGNPTEIVSGVSGKKLKYNRDSFQVIELSNTDRAGKLSADIDGYVTVKFGYDEEGRQTKDNYYDANGNLWKNPDEIFGTFTIYEKQNLIAKQYNLDQNDQYTSNKDGIHCFNIIFNDKQQSVGLENLDRVGALINDADGVAGQRYSYDTLNRLNQMKFYDSYGAFTNGFILDFNKEGTHVLRIWSINVSGERILNEDYGVNGKEIELDGQEDLPLLTRFVNSNNQLIPCTDGYYAVRRWDDEKERTIKECFYNNDGFPMTDSFGVFGHKYEYIGENTVKKININKEENPVVDKDGVCIRITKSEKDKESLYYYDIKEKPAIGKGYFGLIVETTQLSDGKLIITTFIDEKNQPILLLSGWAKMEEEYDSKNRLIKFCCKNLEHDLVPNGDGDYIVKKSYSDDGLIATTTICDINGNPCNGGSGYCYTEEITDEEGRQIKSVFYDVNEKLIQLNDGSFGNKYEYDEKNNTKTTIYLGKDEEPANNTSGFAYREQKFDSKGRVISQRDLNHEKKLVGDVGIREFVDNEDRICAFFIHWLDENNELSPESSGAYYIYHEQDAKERDLKKLFFGKSMEPISVNDGDYGIEFSYDDEENSIIVVCLDSKGDPHNNNSGYSKIKRYLNDNEQVVKGLYFTLDGEPFMFEKGSYGFVYEYLSNGAKITGYLDENGLIHQNSEGYAYKEEWMSPDESTNTQYYYDVAKKNTKDLSDGLGDYGKCHQKKENEEKSMTIFSLDKSGDHHINKKGYWAQKRYLDEFNRVKLYYYIDMKAKPVTDDAGDYGTSFEYFEDGYNSKMTSLDRHGNPHNNNYGYVFSYKIIDIAGDEFTLYYNKKNKQVIPKQSFLSIFKSQIKIIKRKFSPDKDTFNARQMGATHTLVLVRQEKKGLAKKHGLTGTYLMLQYNDLSLTHEIAEIEEMITYSKTNPKRLIMIPIELDGPNLSMVGECFEVDFPAGVMGFRITSWSVNQQTWETIFEAYDEYNKRTNLIG